MGNCFAFFDMKKYDLDTHTKDSCGKNYLNSPRFQERQV
jgi:hypothetical protein